MQRPGPFAKGLLAGFVSVLVMEFVAWAPVLGAWVAPLLALIAAAAGIFGPRCLATAGCHEIGSVQSTPKPVRQFVTGGQTDQWPLIFAVAVVPIVAGVALGVAGRDEWLRVTPRQ